MADDVQGPIDSGALQADRVVEAEQAAAAQDAKKAVTTPAKIVTTETATAATDGEQDNGESAGDEGEQQPAGEPGKKNTPHGVQKKLDKLTREKYVEREARLAAEAEVQRLRAQANPGAADAADTTAKAPEGKPTLEQFDYDQERFLDALSDWKVDQKLQAADQRRVESEKAKTAAEKADEWAEREQAFIATTPDYVEVAHHAPINYSETMLDFLKDSDVGPQIAYHLGSHLDEAKAIEQLSPTSQAAALARLELTLSPTEADAETTTARPARTITKAPPPPATVTSSGASRRSPSDPNLSTEERIALWRRKKTA